MATKHDWYKAAALALRDRIVHRWLTAEKASYDAGRKRVYYLSLEFLIGRLFTDALNNMGLLAVFEAALGDLGVGLSELRKCEPDAALGNGGLGRLAACFMESMATLAIPAIGYGIRYDFGLFRQIINNGWQKEYPDEWLSFGNPWEFQRPEVVYHVHFGGGVEHVETNGRDRAIWHPAETVQAVAYDTPIVGWRGQHVNALRLWSARSPDPLKLDVFNTGDYLGASAEEARAESICKFLYPNDENPAGRRAAAAPGIFLRLGLAAGSGQPSSRLRWAVTQPRVKGRGAAQRYPPQSRRHRADAHSGRPSQFPLGRCVEDHGRHPVLYQPHAAAGGARDLAGRAVRAAAAAPSGDHLPHQCRASGAGGGALPGRRRFPRLGIADRREVGPTGADGATGLCRLPQHQWRLGDAFRPDEGDRVPRSQPSLSRPHHQQDQRHHLPPLADAGQSEADRPVARGLRRGGARRSHPAFASRGPRQRQRVPGAVPQRQASQQDRAGAADRRAPRHQGRSGRIVRRPDQAHPRIQAAVAQHPGSRRALSRDQGRSASRLGAARQNLRRQGGGELPLRQADHQADQRRRRGRQQRPRGRRTPEDRVPAPTTMSALRR